MDPPPGVGDQPWQIRTVEDLLFTAPDLATLRAWIAEGRLHPDDQVSRTGRHWLRLGDMPEFSTAFTGFTDLPPVFEEVEPASPISAVEQLGPPPSFGGTMPVVQGVDTGMLVVDSPASDFLSDSGVGIVSSSPAVERERPPPPPPPPSGGSEASGPAPFPITSVGIDDEDDVAIDESVEAMRSRPRPSSTTARVSAIPDVVEDVPIEAHRQRRSNPTVRYGSDAIHSPASMLDAVTDAVDKQERDLAEREVRPREPSGKRPAAPVEVDDSVESDEIPVRSRKRRRADSVDEIVPRRSSWPLVAGLGLLAGVAIIFGVPSIRAKVLDVAGGLVGNEAFDPGSLKELDQAEKAMASLDPVAMGEAEAALQGRIDGGDVPPQGVASMKLAQVELLATRAIERAIGQSVGVTGQASGPDDVERATRILGSVVVEDVVDRTDMRRVRATLRLAQGRPDAEILPLLPEDGSGELRQLVLAAPLWRDTTAPVPDGAIAGLEGLSPRSSLVQLALGLAYLRAGDEVKALGYARGVLASVPGQPTAEAIEARVDAATGGSGTAEGDSGGEDTEGGGGSGGAEESADDGETPAETPKNGGKKPVKTESIDSLIGRGCDYVDSGRVAEGVELLRKATARRPTDLDAQVCLGQGQLKQGKTSKALATFEGILSRSPSFAPALRHAAKAADKLGQTEKAVGYYRKLLGLRPRDPTALAYVEAHG